MPILDLTQLTFKKWLNLNNKPFFKRKPFGSNMQKKLESWNQSLSDSPFMCMDEKIMPTKAQPYSHTYTYTNLSQFLHDLAFRCIIVFAILTIPHTYTQVYWEKKS